MHDLRRGCRVEYMCFFSCRFPHMDTFESFPADQKFINERVMRQTLRIGNLKYIAIHQYHRSFFNTLSVQKDTIRWKILETQSASCGHGPWRTHLTWHETIMQPVFEGTLQKRKVFYYSHFCLRNLRTRIICSGHSRQQGPVWHSCYWAVSWRR